MTATLINQDEEIVTALESLVANPLAYVYWAFEWNKGELRDWDGPDAWQREVLNDIRHQLLTNPKAPIRIAVRSGHGIGKSALIAWIILWFMDTRPNCQVVLTANTKAQLETKTWRELGKWHKRSITRDYFTKTATKFARKGAEDVWFAAMIPWSEQNPEAFQGAHDENVLVLFDEASAIPDIIWETADGAMTTPGAMWVAFGNPTRNTGRFSECFKKFRHRWINKEIDSRTCKMANQEEIAQMVADWGEDSDYVRVRVKGQEPRAGFKQFIPNDIVEPYLGKTLNDLMVHGMPKIMGVDIARGGDDMSVLCRRQGGQVFDLQKERIDDSMALGDIIAYQALDWGADALFIDMGNIGASVYDYLVNKLHLNNQGVPVIGVWFGGDAIRKDIYANKRIEMWATMKDHLKSGGMALPNDVQLRDDLVGPEFGFQMPSERMLLESKRDMKSRGLASPDCADALALTYAAPVAPKSLAEIHPGKARHQQADSTPLSRWNAQARRGGR